MHTATPHADSQTLLISTTLAVCAGRDYHLTSAIILAFKLVTVTGVAQEERLDTRQTTTVRVRQCARREDRPTDGI